MEHCTYCHEVDAGLWQMDCGKIRLCPDCIYAEINFKFNNWLLYRRKLLGRWRRFVEWVKKILKRWI
jgi:hypothetical protein